MRDGVLDLWWGGSCVGCGVPGRLACALCWGSLPARGSAAWPSPRPVGLVAPSASGPYDGWLRAALLAFKESRAFGLRDLLAQRLLWALAHGLALSASQSGSLPDAVGLVPMPTVRARVWRRGHDPVASLVAAACRQAAAIPGWPRLIPAPVLRVRAEPADQAGLSAQQRARNVHGTLWAPTAQVRRWRAQQREGPALWVCDDVITTGATVAEAQRALANVGLVVQGAACVAATQRRGGQLHSSVPAISLGTQTEAV